MRIVCKPKLLSLLLSVTALLGWRVVPNESFTGCSHVADSRNTAARSSRRLLPGVRVVVFTRLQVKKKTKESMAEKRKRRARRLPPPKPIHESVLPARAIQLESPQRPADNNTNQLEDDTAAKTPDTITSTTPTTTTTPDLSSSTPVAESSSSVQTKAQKLLESQRDSVALLTAVRKAVERVDRDVIRQQLDERGYWYGDDFLSEPPDSSSLHPWVDAMMAEGVALLQGLEQQQQQQEANNNNPAITTTTSTTTTTAPQQQVPGSGEFVALLMGGEGQYPIAPRSIEWVVSVTQHVPARQFTRLPLSSAHCIAAMRTLDRNVLKASWKLVTGQDLDNDDDKVETPIHLPPRPAGRVVTDPATDRRRLSLYYYLVPETWDVTCGGGLTFVVDDEKEGNPPDEITVAARRDRLILFRSDTVTVRPEPWKGRRDMPHGSCIELQLLEEPAR